MSKGFLQAHAEKSLLLVLQLCNRNIRHEKPHKDSKYYKDSEFIEEVDIGYETHPDC